MRRHSLRIVALSRRWGPLLAALIAVMSCMRADSIPGPGPIARVSDSTLVAGLSVSAPVADVTISPDRASAQTPAALSGPVSYVSLVPGTVPGGTVATIRDLNTDIEATAPMVEGGFDPQPIPANLGDTLEVAVSRADGSNVAAYIAVVNARPRLIRTRPPRGGTDVPVNIVITIVFSEPVDPATVNPTSVTLSDGVSLVPGEVHINPATGYSVEFTPSAPLAPLTTYTLSLESSITNLAGTPLATTASTFTTGTAVAAVASVAVSPETVTVTPGQSLELTAVLRDADGNVLSGRGVEWTSTDATIASVSALGVVTGRAVGGPATITAASEGKTGSAQVSVVAAVASVAVSPETVTVTPGQTLEMTAVLRDADGSVLSGRSVEWTSSDATIASVSASGVVTGGAIGGPATITAASEGKTGSAHVSVAVIAVASVAVSPATVTVVPGQSIEMTAVLRAADGSVLSGRSVEWTSSDATIASVSASGVVTGGAMGGPATITAASEGKTGSAQVSVVAAVFVSVSTGENHTCGLTTTGAAYCWGMNMFGQIGDGTTTNYERPTPGATDRLAPVLVAGALTFASLEAGMSHTCGLTTGGTAYCWGDALYGEVGTGVVGRASSGWIYRPYQLIPAPVVGGLTFRSIEAGGGTTCGLTANGTAYCWGANWAGNLGIGPPPWPSGCQDPEVLNSQRSCGRPLAVVNAPSFAAVSPGGYATCGVTTGGAGYCWGSNLLASDTCNWPLIYVGPCSHVPLPVQGSETFVKVSSSSRGDSCWLTTVGTVLCGNTAPVAVGGGLTFVTLSTGGPGEGCGVTSTGAGYCWGPNVDGKSGDGTTTRSEIPVAVSGGLTFRMISSRYRHTCGVTIDGAVYCWGSNPFGQLGNGTTQGSTTPVRVVIPTP